MTKLGILAATALSLTLAVATPASAAWRGGGGHVGGGGMHMGGGAMHMGGNNAAFRGAQASIGAGRPAAMSGGNFAGRGGAQFAQGGFRGQGRHFGPGVGFAAGLAAGSALGYGAYDPYYYGDNYAYYGDDYAYDAYDNGAYPATVVPGPGYVVSSAADPAYCAQRYRSYDPASGTYLGYDGLRHPCGE
jgi:BA14K-like protein